MYGKDQWIGKEVEGRYSDILTYFVRDLSFGLDLVEHYHEYPHYYFTIEYMKNCGKDSDEIRQIRTILDKTVQKLKQTDTLSIDAGWYRVHQITKCNLMEINPDNYKFDREI